VIVVVVVEVGKLVVVELLIVAVVEVVQLVVVELTGGSCSCGDHGAVILVVMEL